MVAEPAAPAPWRDHCRPMRALIVTNMYPGAARPALGRFVADQVAALRRTGEVDLEVFSFDPGGYGAYAGAAHRLRARRHDHAGFDIVHAHYGLTTWPALAAPARARVVTLHGTDLAHPRARPITLAGLRFNDLVGVVSAPLAAAIPRWAWRGRVAVLPCGVDLHRFGRIDRTQARACLGLDPQGPYLLFAADPSRPEKRHDLALAAAGDTELLTLGDVDPGQVPLWVNAANAVLAPSDREGFGLSVLEALACDVPVLATPVGIAPEVLAGVSATLCAPFDLDVWRAALAPHLAASDPRVAGRARAELYSSDRMARRVLDAWQGLLLDR
jgi:teichuronic acid biosynthesis glycosyltransferase TuaC